MTATPLSCDEALPKGSTVVVVEALSARSVVVTPAPSELG